MPASLVAVPISESLLTAVDSALSDYLTEVEERSTAETALPQERSPETQRQWDLYTALG
jgi:hypothetical protein